MSLAHRLNRWFKPRFAIFYPFAIFVLIIGYTTESSIRTGIGFVIAGMLIRLWSNGYAIKNNKLTTSGPYAFVRNPLYLGTFLMCIGLCIMLNLGWLGVIFVATMALVYVKTIKSEQGALLEKFGSAFKDYLKHVPAMIPTLIPYAQGEKWPFSLQRLIDSKEHKPVFWVIILMMLFHLKTRILIEHKDMTAKSWTLVFIIFVLVVLDITYELNKKKIHAK